jgi:glycosyltransferase involved in cell wall biosynthesis
MSYPAPPSDAGKRITFLSWRDAGHPDGGGSELYVEEIARRLAARGHEVTIVCATYPGATPEQVLDGVRFRRSGGRLGVYVHGLRFLRSAEGRSQDVVVDVINGIPFAARLVRRRGLVVLVHHVHKEQWKIIYPGLRGKIGWFIESQLSPRLYRRTRHITVSQSTESELISLGINPALVTIVRNGVDSPRVSAPEHRSVTPRICVLSRLVPHKQIDHALLAMTQLKTKFPQLHLDIIGDGWWAEQLHRQATELDLNDRVTFHGYLPVEKRDRVLEEAWLMLAPSIKEGWGIAIMEAAAHGTPTVAYRSGGGVRESIVDGETGLLASDLGDLIQLTQRLLTDEALRSQLSQKAARRARTFSWDLTATDFETALQGIGCPHVPKLAINPGLAGRRIFHDQFGGFRGDGAHAFDEGA